MRAHEMLSLTVHAGQMMEISLQSYEPRNNVFLAHLAGMQALRLILTVRTETRVRCSTSCFRHSCAPHADVNQRAAERTSCFSWSLAFFGTDGVHSTLKKYLDTEAIDLLSGMFWCT